MNTQRFTGMLVVITLLSSLLSVGSAQSSESGPADEPIKIQRIKGPVELDGLSNEAAWEGVKSLPMVMSIPIYGSAPSQLSDI